MGSRPSASARAAIWLPSSERSSSRVVRTMSHGTGDSSRPPLTSPCRTRCISAATSASLCASTVAPSATTCATSISRNWRKSPGLSRRSYSSSSFWRPALNAFVRGSVNLQMSWSSVSVTMSCIRAAAASEQNKAAAPPGVRDTKWRNEIDAPDIATSKSNRTFSARTAAMVFSAVMWWSSTRTSET
eukprot:Amastigsp_a9786_6.p2 type:complete len:187 gc:universal Amastigsp_a9786_6:873-313(-)